MVDFAVGVTDGIEECFTLVSNRPGRVAFRTLLTTQRRR